MRYSDLLNTSVEVAVLTAARVAVVCVVVIVVIIAIGVMVVVVIVVITMGLFTLKRHLYVLSGWVFAVTMRAC